MMTEQAITSEPASEPTSETSAPAPSSARKLTREISRRLARHLIVLAFAAGVIVLFVIEGSVSLPLAAIGLSVILASALIYTVPLPDSSARRRTQRLYAIRREAANLLPYPLLLANLDGNIRLANHPANSLFGRSQIRGLHISALVRDPDFLDAFAASQKDGQIKNVDWRIHVPVERYFHVHIAAALAPRHRMKPFTLLTFHEQTDIYIANQMRRDFIANASHELKTPLSVFSGYLETLRNVEPHDQETRQKFISVMEEQSQLMVQLIDDLFSLSRIEQQEHRPPSENIDLIAIVREAVKINSSAAQQASLHISFTENPDAAQSQGDAKELVQAISNLINNAIQHGADENNQNKNIKISITQNTFEGQPAWAIAVQDFGQGIAPHHTPRLTERFYRVNPELGSTALGGAELGGAALGGTGLGLAIVKHILTRHRGELRVQSQPGLGSIFTAILPQNNEN